MEDFVPFELAKKLKEKGFREKCYAYWCGGDNYHTLRYNFIQNPAPSRKLTIKDFNACENWYCERNCYDVPTISQVLKWLRDTKQIVFGTVPMQEMDGDYLGWCITIYKVDDNGYGLSWQEELYYQTYESAALAGIEYALDNLI